MFDSKINEWGLLSPYRLNWAMSTCWVMDAAMTWKLKSIWLCSIAEINSFNALNWLMCKRREHTQNPSAEINRCLSHNPKFSNSVHDIFISCRYIHYNKNSCCTKLLVNAFLQPFDMFCDLLWTRSSRLAAEQPTTDYPYTIYM